MRYLEAKKQKKGEAKMRRPFYEDKRAPAPDYYNQDALELPGLVEPAEEAEAGETEEEVEEEVEAWPLKMAPKTYLALHPTGTWADLARRLVGEEAEGGPDAGPA